MSKIQHCIFVSGMFLCCVFGLLKKASRWLWRRRGVSVDTSQGLITPEWVTRVKVSDDQRPETPSDPEFLTEDVSKVYPRAVNLFFLFLPLGPWN